MEMTKEPIDKPRVRPSPFSSNAEREELERLTATATTSQSRQADVIPTVTAVPVMNPFDQNNYVPPAMAVATYASLPPPPGSAHAAAAASSRYGTTRADSNRATMATTKKSEKEEYDDGGITVRPEPPSHRDGNALRTAPSLPTYKSVLPSAEQKTTSSQLRAATAKGSIEAGEEVASVARAQRSVKKTVDEEVRVANAKASRKAWRPDEGLTDKSVLPSAEQKTTSSQLRAATAKGSILAEQEAASVARAQRSVKKTVDEKVRAANAKAYRKVGRPDEGLTVGEDRYHLKSDSGGERREGEDDNNAKLYSKKQGKGGYEVNEYDVKEYDTLDYDVKEYKSVYD
eukprot:CAMPEP_0172577538 /NCGR_PEP_ID=MMETSP1067-20121228/138283_1 /TAXON_ID=265564 ORGANISM="Thalassiosira punctigera, Strain Tpunct2005C2" /NCGR_SAMPLE_ID=MMETSP1067 /ASSEMBLY_ACC=CAM_ASM_000444 /LENGTH=343 /DNA_ID=CAMNT_0013370227 /DNA_START=82 /DNA_END=1113 /DNA_ORIENTATION=-